MMPRRYLATMVSVFCLTVLSGCQMPGEQKILYIDSYHPSDATSDAIMAGIYEVVADSQARLDVCFLDAKRYPQPEAIAAKAEEALETIGVVQPQVVIVSGDAATSFVLAAHLKAGPVPVVFCDIAWTCEPYGLPTETVTGIVAIPPVTETVAVLRATYPDLQRVTVLSGDATWRPDHRAAWDETFRGAQVIPTYASVATYEEWKTRFIEANNRGDAIFLMTHQGLTDWDQADAETFVREHIEVSVVTCDAAMMRCAVFGLTVDGRDQGLWAARTALRLLRGRKASRIPVAQTEQTTAYLNVKLAERIGFEPEEALRRRCHRVE